MLLPPRERRVDALAGTSIGSNDLREVTPKAGNQPYRFSTAGRHRLWGWSTRFTKNQAPSVCPEFRIHRRVQLNLGGVLLRKPGYGQGREIVAFSGGRSAPSPSIGAISADGRAGFFSRPESPKLLRSIRPVLAATQRPCPSPTNGRGTKRAARAWAEGNVRSVPNSFSRLRKRGATARSR